MMKYRSAKYNSDGSIDCEIEHPKHGWIPFTASEGDPEEHGRDIFALIVEGGNIAEYTPPDPAEVLAEKRANTFLSKDDFILSALDLGVLSEADAEQAANGWPAGWDAFFEGKPARERIEAKARWANAANVYRNAPLIEALADFKDLSPEQVDALFGVEV